jgi:hypothetical protein
MFNLVEITASGPVVCLDDEGKPLEYSTGAMAAQAAIKLAADKGVKVQPRRVSNDAWKLREAARFDNGTYIPLPWSGEDWFLQGNVTDHYAHLSTEGKAMIAYTPDADKGAADLQTRVKAGKYLTEFYGHILDAPTIARLATEFAERFEDNELQFAETADDIEHVYVNGPRSCMSHSPSDYSSPIHPVRVYAAGDLQVAYLERDGDITARCIVWPSKKRFGRIYGDETRLWSLLEKQGYKTGDMRGARLSRVLHNNRYVVPYVDCCSRAEDDGKHLILGSGSISLGETVGLAGYNYSCDSCGDGMHQDDAYYCEEVDGYHCEDCHNNLTIYCERLEQTRLAEGSQQVTTTGYRGALTQQTWCERAVERYAFRCDVTDEWFDISLGVEMSGSCEGETWSRQAFEDGGFVCEGGGGYYSLADLVTLDDRSQWSQEHFEVYGTEVDGIFYRSEDAPIDAKPYHCDSEAQFELEVA